MESFTLAFQITVKGLISILTKILFHLKGENLLLVGFLIICGIGWIFARRIRGDVCLFITLE